MSVLPVHGERALEVRAGKWKWLVVADLHIGIEGDYLRKGFKIPDQAPPVLDRIFKLVEERGPDELILLGDVKHRITMPPAAAGGWVPVAGEHEGRQVARFLQALSARLPLTVVKGNHDGGLRQMAPLAVSMVSGMKVGDAAFIHGQSWPSREHMRCRTLVMAHTHPSVLLLDERGRRLLEPCWLRANFRRGPTSEFYKAPHPELVVMPAFGDLRSGMPVNERQARLLGPLFKNRLVDLPGARVHLTNGTYLGKVRDLEVEGRGHYWRERGGSPH